MSAFARGSHTCSVAPLIPSAQDRLLMSSEVQQKWTSSLRSSAPISTRASLTVYSTALTSWTVTDSWADNVAMVSASEPAAMASRPSTSSDVMRRNDSITWCYTKSKYHTFFPDLHLQWARHRNLRRRPADRRPHRE